MLDRRERERDRNVDRIKKLKWVLLPHPIYLMQFSAGRGPLRLGEL